MRFLLGLILGAAMVVVVAEGVGGGGDWEAGVLAVRDYVQHKAGNWRAEPQETARPGPGSAAVAAQAAPAAAQPADVSEPAQAPIPRPPDPRPMDAAGADLARQSGPEVGGDAGEVDAVADAVADAGADAAESSQHQPAPPSSSTPGLQPVWTPFHSEMSASGFAARLTETLDHPFSVERRGPGRYQVIFAYTDEPERRKLLDRAADATGLPL